MRCSRCVCTCRRSGCCLPNPAIPFAIIAVLVLLASPVQAAGVTWTNVVNVTTDAASIRKTLGCDGCADAGAVSVEEIASDGYVEFVPVAGARVNAGLGQDRSTSTAPAAINYAFAFWPDNTWDIRELGVYRKAGVFAPGDVFRIAVEGGVVRYYQNGVERYASTVAPPSTLVVDTTVYRLGSGLTGVALVPLLAAAPPPPGTGEGITDRLTRPKPPVPVLGPAGFAFNDPVFGSRMLRVTDGRTRPGAPDRSYKTPSAAHQNAWNTTSTRFYTLSSGGAYVPFEFDPSTMRAKRIAPTLTGDGGLMLKFTGEPQFSYVHEELIFGAYSPSPRTIAEYNFSTGQYSMLLDLQTVGAASGTYMGGITSSSGPVEKISVFYGGSSQDRHDKVVVFERDNPSRRRVLNTMTSTIDGVPTAIPLNFPMHHSYIDRSGRYVMLSPTGLYRQAPRNAPPQVVWDLQTDVMTELPANAALSNGHDALGFGVWLNKDCCTSTSWDAIQWQVRSLATPFATRDVIKPVLQPTEIYLSDHPSWHNADPNRLMPFVTAPYRYGTNTVPWRAWDDEIIAVQTDNVAGGATVWRYGHHRSDVGSDADPSVPYFWYMPRVNVSQSGRWAIFTSNWEKTLGVDPGGTEHRQDVFVIELKGMPSATQNEPPVVTLSSPSASAVLVAGSTTQLTAVASDVDGTIRQVSFEVNGVIVGTVATAPYSLTWRVPAAGTYAIRAIAVDSAGATGASPVVTIRTDVSNQPPVVSAWTSATRGIQVGSTIDLSADAVDVDGVVQRVEFFVNGQSVAVDTAAPFSVRYAVTAPGLYTLTARAVDDALAASTSAPVAFEATSEIVIYAADAARVAGDMQLVADTTAAAGRRLWNPNRGAAKAPVSATPVTYADYTFFAEAGRAYHLWVRGRAEGDQWSNDSFYVQFSGALSATQVAVAAIGTTQAMSVILEQGLNAGVAGWGWTDNAYDGLGAPIYFAKTGVQTIRFLPREDGLSIDQIVLSPQKYFTVSPGLAKNDGTIVGK